MNSNVSFSTRKKAVSQVLKTFVSNAFLSREVMKSEDFG